jgi:hypothetical protein
MREASMAHSQGVVPGLVLQSVSGRAVEGAAFDDVLGWLRAPRSAQSPLVLLFARH